MHNVLFPSLVANLHLVAVPSFCDREWSRAEGENHGAHDFIVQLSERTSEVDNVALFVRVPSQRAGNRILRIRLVRYESHRLLLAGTIPA